MTEKEKLTSHERLAVTAVMYNIIFVNETAVSAMFEAMNSLEESPCYRHKIKYWAGVVRRLMREYNQKLDKRSGGHIEFLAGLNDRYEEQLGLDLFKLRNACVLALQRHHVPEPNLSAQIYVAATLVSSSCRTVDHCFDSYPDYKHYGRFFAWMRLSAMERAFINLCTEYAKEIKRPFQLLLDEDMNVQNGFRALANKLRNADNIIDTANEHAVEWEREHS